MTSPWWCRRWPARPTSWWNGAARPRRCMMRANMTPWWPPANRSPPGCWRSCCRRIGIQARSWQGWQIPIRTSDAHASARILEIDGSEIDQPFQGPQGSRRHRRLPGHQSADRPNHHARARRFRHLGGGDRGRHPCRPLRHLYRRRRRLYHRPARGAEGAAARQDRVRGHAGTGLAGRQGAAGPLGGTRHGAQHAGVRPLQLRQARGYRPARQRRRAR